MHVGRPGLRFVQVRDLIGREDSYGDFLCDDGFAVSSASAEFRLVEGHVEGVGGIVGDGGEAAEGVGRGGSYDCQGENGDVVFFCEANLCGGCV